MSSYFFAIQYSSFVLTVSIFFSVTEEDSDKIYASAPSIFNNPSKYFILFDITIIIFIIDIDCNVVAVGVSLKHSPPREVTRNTLLNNNPHKIKSITEVDASDMLNIGADLMVELDGGFQDLNISTIGLDQGTANSKLSAHQLYGRTLTLFQSSNNAQG